MRLTREAAMHQRRGFRLPPLGSLLHVNLPLSTDGRTSPGVTTQ